MRIELFRFRQHCGAFIAAVLAFPAVSQAKDWATQALTVQIDVRYVDTDAQDSFTQGGLGLARFDEGHDALQVGRFFLQYHGSLTETVDAHLTVDTYADHDKNPVDVTEAFVQWRPFPSSGWRWRTKLGAFNPPVSLENRDAGWQSAYSLSPGAVNSWLGEELRIIGAETELTWLGSRTGSGVDLSLISSLYGWNDPLGVQIFQRGWAIHDRQTALFGGLPKIFLGSTARHQVEFFHEIDDRAGYYVGAQATWPDRLELRVLHYDNRGDPAASNGFENAWLTRFDSAGLRFEWRPDWTFIAQWMNGDTAVGPSADGLGLIRLGYESYFALVSGAFGRHRITARYDDLSTHTLRGAMYFNGNQDAEGWTLGYSFDFAEHWQLWVETLQVKGELEQRALMGLDPGFRERTVQCAFRFSY